MVLEMWPFAGKDGDWSPEFTSAEIALGEGIDFATNVMDQVYNEAGSPPAPFGKENK